MKAPKVCLIALEQVEQAGLQQVMSNSFGLAAPTPF